VKNRKPKWKGLNAVESVVFIFLTYIYYYCLLCLAAVIILLIVAVVSGESNPVFDAIKNSTESAIIIAIGSILFLPVTLLRNKYIKKLKSNREK